MEPELLSVQVGALLFLTLKWRNLDSLTSHLPFPLWDWVSIRGTTKVAFCIEICIKFCVKETLYTAT